MEKLQILVPVEDSPGDILHDQSPAGRACPVLRKLNPDSDLGKVTGALSDALKAGPASRALMLEKRSCLVASGSSDGPAYLLISNREGGFARVEFYLDDDGQKSSSHGIRGNNHR